MIGRWKRRGNHLATAKLAVRQHRPWYILMGLSLLGAAVLVGLGMLLFRYGEYEGRRDSDAILAAQGASREASRLMLEVADVRQKFVAAEQQLRLELATRETLSRQLQQLQSDNGGLRERVGFYESLLTKTGRDSALGIEVFRVEALNPGRYRLSAILLQGQSSQAAFKGELEFRLTFERNGKRETLIWPQPREPFTVSRFTRLERETDLPVDVTLKQVELRIYAAGESRARLTRIYDVKG